MNPNDTTSDDGQAIFSTDIDPNLLVGVALHELTHAMGRVPYGSQPDIFDLFRFTSPGNMLFNGANKAPAAYFSTDNGVTKLAAYGQTSDPSDFLNGGVQGPNDPFNEFYSSTTLQTLTTVDLLQMDALGFHLVSNSSSGAFTVSLMQDTGTSSIDNVTSNDAAERAPAIQTHRAIVDRRQFRRWSGDGRWQRQLELRTQWTNGRHVHGRGQ